MVQGLGSGEVSNDVFMAIIFIRVLLTNGSKIREHGEEIFHSTASMKVYPKGTVK